MYDIDFDPTTVAEAVNQCHCLLQELQNGNTITDPEWDYFYGVLEELREYYETLASV